MKVNNELIWSYLAFAIVASLTAAALYSFGSQVNVVYAAGGGTNSIGANVAIPHTCIPLLTETAIAFPSTAAGSFVSTANVETVTNFGNEPSNIFVEGNDLVYGANVIAVGNILWNPASGANIGNQLTTTYVDTQISIAENGQTNDIYFGANIPLTANSGTYSTTVNVMLSC